MTVNINRNNGTGLNIWQANPTLAARPHEIYAPGFHHLAFNVERREEVEAVREVVEAAGGEILEGPGEYPFGPGGYYALNFLGPDRLKFEVVHMPLAEARFRELKSALAEKRARSTRGAMFDFDQALLRAPSVSVVRGLRTRPGPPIDPFAFAHEHAAYAAALESAGLAVEILPPLEAFPDSVFIEDPALVFSAGAVLLAPGAASRRGEAAALKSALERRFGRVEALGEGSVDGGDVLALPGKVLIGLSERTDARGATALARILGRFGLAAEPVATPAGLLHLKTGASLLDEETVVVSEALAGSAMFAGLRSIVLPPGEASAANVLRVGRTVLVAQGAPRTAELIAARGLEVVGLATRQINALDAGLTCLSLRWRDSS